MDLKKNGMGFIKFFEGITYFTSSTVGPHRSMVSLSFCRVFFLSVIFFSLYSAAIIRLTRTRTVVQSLLFERW
jgi:hypothetical protein